MDGERSILLKRIAAGGPPDAGRNVPAAVLRLNYPPALVDRPVVAGLISKFGLEVNILRARVTRDDGWLVVEGPDHDASVDWRTSFDNFHNGITSALHEYPEWGETADSYLVSPPIELP